MWDCTCACGRRKRVNHSNLRSGRTRSCGCLSAERYGSLTVVRNRANSKALKHAERNAKTAAANKWKKVNRKAHGALTETRICVCDCDLSREVEFPYEDLRNGAATHCGCGAVPTVEAINRGKHRGRLSADEMLRIFALRHEQGWNHKRIACELAVTETSVFKLLNGLTHAEMTLDLRASYAELEAHGQSSEVLGLLMKERSYRWRDSLSSPLTAKQIAARGARPYRNLSDETLKERITREESKVPRPKEEIERSIRAASTAMRQATPTKDRTVYRELTLPEEELLQEQFGHLVRDTVPPEDTHVYYGGTEVLA